MKKRNFKIILKMSSIFLAAFILSRTSSAYQTVGETAEILPENYYKLGVIPQVALSDGGGANLGVYFDTFLAPSLNGRVELGGGKTDFWVQASAKWVPIPDVDRQPAVGLRTAVAYARDASQNFYNIQLTPIISKKADTRYGEMIPYVALPVTLINTSNKGTVATQFTIGAEWFQNKDVNYGAEVNLNMNNTFTSVAAFVSFPFDGTVGFKK